MIQILRYTEAIQKALGCKTKPEPWLHIGISSDGHYGIWIWDTRQILETGKCDADKVNGTPAKDNHKELVGEHAELFKFGRSTADSSQNYILVRGFRWYSGGRIGDARGKLVHDLEKAKAAAGESGQVFNWADAHVITNMIVHDMQAKADKNNDKAARKFLSKLGNCKIYAINKAARNASDSTPPPVGMRYYATSDYTGVKCYCVSDGSVLGSFVKAFDPLGLQRDYKAK